MSRHPKERCGLTGLTSPKRSGHDMRRSGPVDLRRDVTHLTLNRWGSSSPVSAWLERWSESDFIISESENIDIVT